MRGFTSWFGSAGIQYIQLNATIVQLTNGTMK